MGTKSKVGSNIWPYLLVAPAVLIILAVIFVPIASAVSMSLQSYDLRRPANIAFIGLDNYRAMFNDALFWSSFRRTLQWVGFGVGGQFIFGFILALLLNQRIIGRGLVRSVSLIPWCTPGVLIGLMWRWMYDGNIGVINDLLRRFNIIDSNIPFLAFPTTALHSVIVTIIWQGIPFFALMILAGLQGIPEELYESADIDGANFLHKLFFITVPLIKNVIFITALLRVIWVTNSVDVILNMTGGGPAYSTQTLSIYIFNRANVLDMGYAAAMAITMAVLLSIAAIPYLINTFKGGDNY